MYEIPFSKMIQPRARRDLGLQREGHRLRELREVQPGGQLAAPRRLVGPQPHRDLRRRAVRRRTASLFAAVPVASSSGKLFVPDMTPRRVDEFLVGTAHQLAPRWTARALRPVSGGEPLLGGHEQQRPGRLQPAGGDSPGALHPEPRRAAGPDRQRVELRHRRARRRLHQVLGGHRRVGVAGRQDVRPRLVHVEPLLRQLRPGQLRRRPTTRTSSSARRSSPTARGASSGTSGTATCAATGPTC